MNNSIAVAGGFALLPGVAHSGRHGSCAFSCVGAVGEPVAKGRDRFFVGACVLADYVVGFFGLQSSGDGAGQDTRRRCRSKPAAD